MADTPETACWTCSTLVRVDVGDRGVVDGRCRGGIIELVLVVEGRDLE
jgi:hypothetical protein